ncbi:MAG: glycosyltransferase family 2 protein [Thermoplasmata archaeon]|nr:glycosyltransferase family 2 protein [Thermoplasmata archaeon]
MPGDPEVAVIVGAYGRREYLLRAVRTVLAQTVGRDRVEIRVTKDFADPEVDAALAELRIPSTVDADPRIGTWLGRAIAATRAPLIAFLDDDDEFEPERLERVLEVFRQHPEVGFYRNRVRVIDGSGRPVPVDRWRPIETDLEFDGTGPILLPPGPKAGALALGTERTHSSFNSSTMVVRRELLTGSLGTAFAETQTPDLFLFLAGVLGPYGLFLDDRRLTRFRRYEGNVTRRIGWLAAAAHSYRSAGGAAREFGRPEFGDWLEARADHFDRMYRGATLVSRVRDRADRREVARLAIEYARFLDRHPAERALTLDTWGAAVYALGYLFVPSLTCRVEARRRAGLPA